MGSIFTVRYNGKSATIEGYMNAFNMLPQQV